MEQPRGHLSSYTERSLLEAMTRSQSRTLCCRQMDRAGAGKAG